MAQGPGLARKSEIKAAFSLEVWPSHSALHQ